MNPIQIRNMLLKAFAINYVAVFLTWLISLTGFYHGVMLHFFKLSPEASTIYLLYLLGIWKILGVVLFLIPAAALHWEFREVACCKKKE